MRLLTWNDQAEFSFTEDLADAVPPYAILSHTWGSSDEEVKLADLQSQNRRKQGYTKIQFCGHQARTDHLEYFWVDTCCINQENQNELSEAITSMFRWYRGAEKCYVYLSDVSVCQIDDNRGGNGNGDGQPAWESDFRTSRWFTRGWTLQELLAPKHVEFFSREGTLLGTKRTLARQIHEITTIPLAALHDTPLDQFPISERLRWTERRQTKKKEDRAYCLLGIFDVFMPLLYGEGENAFHRLQKEIDDKSGRGATTGDKPVESTRLGLCLATAPLMEPTNFVGRAIEIGTIHNHLRPTEMSMEQQRVVIGGIGGIGKTQLAIAYARKYKDNYKSVIWLNASSESTLYTSFRSVARAIITADEPEGPSDEQILQRVHDWLSRPSNTQWLLVFDNYDDPDRFAVDSFCPNCGYGSIIITTRLPDMVMGPQVRLQPLQMADESLEILRTRSGREFTKQDLGACRLVERLGGFPLALATTGAFLRKTTLTFQQYLDTYEQRWRVDPRRPPRLQEYKDRTLYTTWDLSYRRLQTEDPEAAMILRLLAYFDNQDIWYELLCAATSSFRHPHTRFNQPLKGRVDFESVMRTLADYCFLEVQYTTGSYAIHNCVHDWILAELNDEPAPSLYWYAFDCVAASIGMVEFHSLGEIRYRRISRHAIHLVHRHFDSCAQFDFDGRERFENAMYIAYMLRAQAQLNAAKRMYERILAASERTDKLFGWGLIEALDAASHLGTIYHLQDKLEEMNGISEWILAGCKKLLRSKNIPNSATLDNLGLLCFHQGRIEEAERISRETLATCEEVLGPEHFQTLCTARSLSAQLDRQDKFEEAEVLTRQVLAVFQTVLGMDNPWTLTTINTLGLLYSRQDRVGKAEEMYRQALAGFDKVFGIEHASTLTTMSSLGFLYHRQHKFKEAEGMYIRALAGYEKIAGPQHSWTISVIQNLRDLYLTHGNLAEAEHMHMRIRAASNETA